MDDVARPEQSVDIEQNEGCGLRDGACTRRDAGDDPCGKRHFNNAQRFDEGSRKRAKSWNSRNNLNLRGRTAEEFAPQTFVEPDRRNGNAYDNYGWKRDGDVMQVALLNAR